MIVRSSLVCAITVALLSACNGSISSTSSATVAAVVPAVSKVVVTPSSGNVVVGSTRSVLVSEKGYTGSFTSTSPKDTCKSLATWSPTEGKGPAFRVTIVGKAPGVCSIVFSDADAHSAILRLAIQAAPIAYAYTVNYNSNDVSQTELEANGSVKTIAPNFAISNCSGPDAIALAPNENLAFVSCYSGALIALSLDPETHALGASKIPPQTVPRPQNLIVPATGAKNSLYVDASGSSSGGIYAFRFTASKLTPVANYTTTGSYPDGMAFATNAQGNSTLYVANPFDPVSGCTSPSITSGAVEVWAQSASGALTAQPSIPVCGGAYDVAVQRGNLYWAGPSIFGGYALKTMTPLTLAAAPWPAGEGPGYDPQALDAFTAASAPTAARAPAGGSVDPGEQLSVSAANGNLYILGPTGTTLLTISANAAMNAEPWWTQCKYFERSTKIGDNEYTAVCWYARKDGIVVYGIGSDEVRRSLGGLQKSGSLPYAIAVSLRNMSK